ncbi:hypothetical protein NQ315_009587 [Exocentrus adspersus]|uniref:CLIP domain-containing serine protease n=1 Tax=Exocentrus adspersus TaxID=1586481 RepID=A0AAV8WGS3_9CUCU|nr:hypothetical protein NQ315_009587 [Exocentrus adspersus]
MYFTSMISLDGVLWYTVFLLGVTSCNAQWLVDDDGCRTPDRGVGTCMRAKLCKPLIDFLLSVPKPISQEVRTELSKYTCGYDGSIKVCCPSNPIVISTKREDLNLLLDSPSPPPDITNHKNIGLLPKDCGYLGSPDKIRNGKDAKLDEFPWMALLSYNTNRGPQFQCGGTIVNNKYILTAAHCISDLIFPLVGVRVGEHKISTKVDCEIRHNGKEFCSPNSVQDLAIEEVIIHPQFNRSIIVNDIGLLRVSEMNMDVENVRPVCLPTSEETRNASFNYCVVTGWGFTDSQGQNADVLQKVDLPVMNLTQCREIYKSEKKVKLSHRQLCAGGRNNKDSCPGDSGGPLHVASFINDETRYVQQGVVSFGHRFCGSVGFPGVYTKVAYYMDWILDNMKP